MISEGRGMHALSIPMVMTIPAYPSWEMKLIIQAPIGSSMDSNMWLVAQEKAKGKVFGGSVRVDR